MGNAVVTGAHGVQYRPDNAGSSSTDSGGFLHVFNTKSIWSSVRDGTAIPPNASARQNAVTMWQLDKKGTSPERVQAAQLGIKRLRTLRHPGILKYLDSIDTQDQLILITEKAYPVHAWLREAKHANVMPQEELQTSVVWGLYCVTKTLAWLHEDCKMVHGNLSSDAVFVTEKGDWCLGSLETTFHRDDKIGFQTAMYRVNLNPIYHGPERGKNSRGMEDIPPSKAHVLDSWGLGILFLDAYYTSGLMEGCANLSPILETSVDTITQQVLEYDGQNNSRFPRMSVVGTAYISGMPSSLRSGLVNLLDPGYRTRLSVKAFMDVKSVREQFFGDDIVSALHFIDNLALKEPNEKKQFFEQLHSVVKGTAIPASIARCKILPALKQALQMGAQGGGGAVCISPLIEMGSKLSAEEYQREVVPEIISMFRSTERATRMQLLNKLDSYVAMIDRATLNGEVCKNILTGFFDNSEPLRQATLKSTVTLAPHLQADRLLDVVSRGLKKSIKDSVTAVRINTLVALGQIIRYFPEAPAPEPPYIAQDYDDFAVGDKSYSDESKRYVPRPVVGKYQSGSWEIFLAGLRDPSPATRASALRALSYSCHCFSPSALTGQVMPHCSKLCTDPNSTQVRELAMTFLSKMLTLLQIEHRRLARAEEQRKKDEAGKHMSDGTAKPSIPSAPQKQQQNAVGNAVGWAVSSLMSGKFSNKPAEAKSRIGNIKPQVPDETMTDNASSNGYHSQNRSQGTTHTPASPPAQDPFTAPATPHIPPNVTSQTQEGNDGWDDDLFGDFDEMDWSPSDDNKNSNMDLDLLDSQGTMNTPSAQEMAGRRSAATKNLNDPFSKPNTAQPNVTSNATRPPPAGKTQIRAQKIELDDDWDDFDAW